MKEIDVTKQVMMNVSHFEKKRSRRWLTTFFIGLFLLVCIVAYGVWQTYQTVSDPEFLDVFSLYSHDSETFSELWKEALSFVWGNLPQVIIVVSTLAFIIFWAVVVLTRKRRKIVFKRMSLARKYNQK